MIERTQNGSYTRGIDLSGTLEGAGGIGGLLARSSDYSGANPTVHNYYFADGNGNITYMLDNSQSMVASYRYDPFGKTISKSGTLADDNVYRFSSKEFHLNSGLYYFGYRFYDPSLQRWINRDPMQEAGGLNLYEFASNNPLSKSDPLGLDVYRDTHPVAFGENHSFVLLEVNCKSSWYKIAPFTLRSLPNGDHYVTLGAGPSFGPGGHLINGVDREKDVDLSTVNYSRKIIDPPGMSDDDFIAKLLNTHQRYNEKAWYTLFPHSDDNYYNSNSYASGLLNIALGFEDGNFPQQPPNTPGFDKPVPHSYFP
jgi:RHS repeat-associated protein